jgi:hypothetical protein
MSRIKITTDGYLQLDTKMNHIYEVGVDTLIYDKNFINHLTEKNWFDEQMFFELIKKLQSHKSYNNYDFTEIIFSAAQKFYSKRMLNDNNNFEDFIRASSFEYLSNTF